MEKINIRCGYRFVKEALFGYYYYQIGDTTIGRVEDNDPEEGFLTATLGYLDDFFQSFNHHDFTNVTARELFDFANAQELGEEGAENILLQLHSVSTDLQNNLKVIPPTDLFDDFAGGIFRIDGKYHFYCTLNDEELLNTDIDFAAFENEFKQLKSAIAQIKA
jgi:hypothetical protein